MTKIEKMREQAKELQVQLSLLMIDGPASKWRPFMERQIKLIESMIEELAVLDRSIFGDE